MQHIETTQAPASTWLVQALVLSILVHLLFLLLPDTEKPALDHSASAPPLEMTLQQRPPPPKPAPPPEPKPEVMTKVEPIKPKTHRARPAPKKATHASAPITTQPVAATRPGNEIAIGDLNLGQSRGKELKLNYSDLKPTAPAQEDAAIRSQESDQTRAIFGIWESQLRQKVERIGRMNFPRDEQGRLLFGQIQFRLVLDENGQIADLSLLQSSGDEQLDHDALQIIRRSASFGPIPVELLDRRRQIMLTRYFEFADERTQWRK